MVKSITRDSSQGTSAGQRALKSKHGPGLATVFDLQSSDPPVSAFTKEKVVLARRLRIVLCSEMN